MNTPSAFRLLRATSLPALAGLLFITSCTAPRAIVATGKVTPQHEFRAGYNVGYNIATAPIAKAGAAIKDAASAAASSDSVRYSSSLNNLQAAALAYLLDPVQTTSDLSLRYGVIPRLDVGYKYAFGSHVFDAQYQLLGPVGTPESPGAGASTGTTYASVGLQFATQRAKLPSIPFLDDINEVLGFSARRRDLIVPLIISHSFGPEEEIGALSYGLAYAHSWVSYEFVPGKVYNDNRQRLSALPTQYRSFSSYGGFVNLKLGYRYVYFVPALSIFYQNYGDFALLNGASTSLSGLTFVPSLGVQVRIPTKLGGGRR
ncbi:hypothetical protein GCM10023185_16270 [Hymenobacter saemangeumensis]|uniref:PorT family protein n=1 Tax=Hymenobacter saemangeumensis TaxID=1084522 RepID=A0ABP8IA51_9BACT